MRHGKKINHLGRTSAHRDSLLSNLANSLLLHKRITTTLAKAKALRTYVEPLITRAKKDSTHNRRIVFSYLQNKEAIKALFNDIADKVVNRPGGYTRIIRIGNRPGDNAKLAMIELVDFNDVYVKDGTKKATATGKKKTRRAGGGKSKSQKSQPAATQPDNTSDSDQKNNEATE